MKKDLIFAPAMLIIGAFLFLLRTTGMTAHIAISVIGILVLIAYTVLTAYLVIVVVVGLKQLGLP